MRPQNQFLKRAILIAELFTDALVGMNISSLHLDQFPRDIRRLVRDGLEIPVRTVPELTLHKAYQRMARYGNHETILKQNSPDRHLYGFLNVGSPLTIVFVEQTLSIQTQNFVIAHELGHYLADVYVLQQRWLEALPGKAGNVRKMFSWNSEINDLSLHALIKGLPERPSQIIERGDKMHVETGDREVMADLIGRELIAPWDMVYPLYLENDKHEFMKFMSNSFGLPQNIAARYFSDCENERSPSTDFLDRLFAPILRPSSGVNTDNEF
jgi:hypothetical protein